LEATQQAKDLVESSKIQQIAMLEEAKKEKELFSIFRVHTKESHQQLIDEKKSRELQIKNDAKDLIAKKEAETLQQNIDAKKRHYLRGQKMLHTQIEE